MGYLLFDHVVPATLLTAAAMGTAGAIAFLHRTDVPADLSIALPVRLDSPRFKSVVHPSKRVWVYHLEMREAGEVDSDVVEWLRAAYQAALP